MLLRARSVLNGKTEFLDASVERGTASRASGVFLTAGPRFGLFKWSIADRYLPVELHVSPLWRTNRDVAVVQEKHLAIEKSMLSLAMFATELGTSRDPHLARWHHHIPCQFPRCFPTCGILDSAIQ